MIQPFPSGPFATNGYVISCPITKECMIVDAPPDSFDSIAKYISDNHLIPKKIVLTHSHWDHTADLHLFKKHYKIPLFVHAEDAENVRRPGADHLPSFIDIVPVEPDHFLQEGDEISVGNRKYKVLHTPGHSPGCVCFYDSEGKILLSGDTLFKGTLGNISFPTSNPKQMWKSLQKLAQLPPDTTVYPGHGSKTTIGAETWLKDAENIFGP